MSNKDGHQCFFLFSNLEHHGVTIKDMSLLSWPCTWIAAWAWPQATTVLFWEFVFFAGRVRNSIAECEGTAGIWRQLDQWALFKAEGRAWKPTSSEEVMEDVGGGQRSAEMRRKGALGTQRERELWEKGCVIWVRDFLLRNQSGLHREGGQGHTDRVSPHLPPIPCHCFHWPDSARSQKAYWWHLY